MTTHPTEPGLACPHTFEPVDWRKVAERLAYQAILCERHALGPGGTKWCMDRMAEAGDRTAGVCAEMLAWAAREYDRGQAAALPAARALGDVA